MKNILIKFKNKKIIKYGLLAVLIIVCGFGIFLTILNFPRVRLASKQNQSRFSIPTIGLLPTTSPSLTLVFTGDVIPARTVNSTMTRLNNYRYPFEKTADFLKEADLTIINLEAPLIKDCPVIDSGMVFCGNEKFIDGLTFAGVDLVTLANNHSSNYGKEGVDNTIKLLAENGIDSVGIDNIVYKEVKGIKFAFLGFNGVSPLIDYLGTIDKDKIKKLTMEARKNADFVIAMFHWSQEYSSTPIADTIAPFDPLEIAHFTIDSGADLIIGNHPHTIQNYEVYKNKLIFYALGNFIFDQMWSEETRTGVVLKLNLEGSKVSSFTLHPIKIDNFAQPRFLEGMEKEQILEQIKKASLKL